MFKINLYNGGIMYCSYEYEKEEDAVNCYTLNANSKNQYTEFVINDVPLKTFEFEKKYGRVGIF